MRMLPLALFAAPLMLGSGPASAHAIESSLAQVEKLDRQFQLESHFSTGTPLQGAAVRLLPPGGGAPQLVGRTDSEGRLRFQLPDGAQPDWELQVDGGSGHRDYLELPSGLGRPPAAALRPGWQLWHATMPGGLLALGALAGLFARRRGTVQPGVPGERHTGP